MAQRQNISVSFTPQQAEIERARALVQEGAEQLDRGDVVDGETFFREWDEELNALETAPRRKSQESTP